MNNKISIIVPVYNKENQIKKCIESIINQTYNNIEIILINDGSEDRSLEICMEYKLKDSRVNVINKLNSGVSDTRNLGIKKATGDFIQFVDADDYIDENMCELLVNKIVEDNSDMVICGYKLIDKNTVKYNKGIDLTINNISGVKDTFSYLYIKSFFNVPWNKLYKRNLITEYYDKNLSLGEDLVFNLYNIKNTKVISFISNCSYNYKYDNIDSLTTLHYNHTRINIAKKLYREVNEFLSYYKVEDKYSYSVNTVFINDVIVSMQMLVYDKELTVKKKKEKLKIWINDPEIENSVRKYIEITEGYNYFNILMKKIIVVCIKNKLCNLIYLFFYFKHILMKFIKKIR